MRIWTPSSWNPSSRLCTRLSMVSASMIRLSRRALLQIGPRLASDSGCSRNTAAALILSRSAVVTVGASLWWAADSRTRLNLGMHLLRVKPSLAVANALDKARFFVLGCSNLIVAVDHKPLLRIFRDRSLDAICNPRIRNLKEKTLRYRFHMMHIPGVKIRAADALSRRPTGSECPPLMELPDDIAAAQDSVSFLPPSVLHGSFLAGIRVSEPQSPSDDIDDAVLDGGSVGEKRRTHRIFPMARPKCLMGDFTNFYGIY